MTVQKRNPSTSIKCNVLTSKRFRGEGALDSNAHANSTRRSRSCFLRWRAHARAACSCAARRGPATPARARGAVPRAPDPPRRRVARATGRRGGRGRATWRAPELLIGAWRRAAGRRVPRAKEIFGRDRGCWGHWKVAQGQGEVSVGAGWRRAGRRSRGRNQATRKPSRLGRAREGFPSRAVSL